MPKNQKTPNREFDELDLTLAKELELDARQSASVIAKKLGISKAIVQRRLHRLSTEEAIFITTVPNPDKLGFQTRVLIGLNVRPGKVDAVVKCLQSNQNINSISLTMGRYAIMVYTHFRNQQELTDFLDVDLRGISDVISADTTILLKHLKSYYNFLDVDAATEKEASPRDLDESELRLIAELELRPQESLTNLGKRLKMSRNTVSRKLNKLIDEKFIRVASIINPIAFGFVIEVGIFVKVNPSKLMSVASTLASEERVFHTVIITGEFDVLIWAVFRNLKEMYHFLRNCLDNTEDIVCYETMVVMAMAKQSLAVLTRGAPSD